MHNKINWTAICLLIGFALATVILYRSDINAAHTLFAALGRTLGDGEPVGIILFVMFIAASGIIGLVLDQRSVRPPTKAIALGSLLLGGWIWELSKSFASRLGDRLADRVTDEVIDAWLFHMKQLQFEQIARAGAAISATVIAGWLFWMIKRRKR